MKKLPELLQRHQPLISIEVFPPKTDRGDQLLFETLDCLTQYQPAFISCTYGAGGSTRTRTIDLCRSIQQKYQIPATSHFTCVGSTREELLEWLESAVKAGIGNIMALRGDAPAGQEEFKAVQGGLAHANELVELIREHHPELGIGVAAYPEKHVEAVDAETDLKFLKQKIDAGADAAFSQLFFVNDNFFRFRDRYSSIGCDVPLIPGIMPITEYARIQRITSMCGAIFPAELADQLAAVQDDAEAQMEIGIEHATRQCQELLAAGVPGIHFYALNKSEACQRILENLNLTPTVSQ